MTEPPPAVQLNDAIDSLCDVSGRIARLFEETIEAADSHLARDRRALARVKAERDAALALIEAAAQALHTEMEYPRTDSFTIAAEVSAMLRDLEER